MFMDLLCYHLYHHWRNYIKKALKFVRNESITISMAILSTANKTCALRLNFGNLLSTSISGTCWSPTVSIQHQTNIEGHNLTSVHFLNNKTQWDSHFQKSSEDFLSLPVKNTKLLQTLRLNNISCDGPT